MSQTEFGDLAYEVMRAMFDIRDELGRFFDEKIYKRELAHCFPGAHLEVPIEVSYQTFIKPYFLDVLVNDGAVFEFKTVDILTPRHESQLLNYLLLAELEHGKLINLRSETIEQKFVNTTLHLGERSRFEIDQSGWEQHVGGASWFHETMVGLLQDWGTGLDLTLYEDALIHFLGGETEAIREVEVSMSDRRLGQQKMRLAAPGVAFKLTTLPNHLEVFEAHATRLLEHTNLEALLWANIGRKTVTFRTLKRGQITKHRGASS
ncbi:MAG: GxxExxY protein [Verrucomicrobiota bacterium]